MKIWEVVEEDKTSIWLSKINSSLNCDEFALKQNIGKPNLVINLSSWVQGG